MKKAPPRPRQLRRRQVTRAHRIARRNPKRAEPVVVRGAGYELRRCDAFEALASIRCDHVILDPPFSARTHGGQRHGRRADPKTRKGNGPAGGKCYSGGGWCSETGLGYEHLEEAHVVDLCHLLHAAARGWIVAMTDHVLFPVWEETLRGLGRYVFAPVPAVIPGMNVRLAGDGPSSWTIWMVVARPRGLRDGTKPGAYMRPPEEPRASRVVKGSKPLGLMNQIILDYTRPGQLVCDPFLGSGTTGVAAVRNGRRFVGFEINPHTFGQAAARISTAQPPLFERVQGATQETLPMTDKPESITAIARATHEANRTYCAALGDDSQVAWDDAPQWQQESAISGVVAVLNGTASTPEEQHEAWMRNKVENGWTYGPEKDPEARTHPCMVPYAELPQSQRSKDAIFRAVVLGMADHLGVPVQ